jgi:hypothetical protein
MRLRIGIAMLLAWGAYWAALPWVDCMRAFMAFGLRTATDSGLQACSFGIPVFLSGPPEHWPNLVFAAVYVIAALFVILRRRPI